jgi:hypothetical protein
MIAIETQDKQFHDGNGTTELGTILPAWWLNQVQDELLAVVQAAQIAPNKATTNQLLAAINAIVGNMINSRGNDFCPSGMVMTFASDFAPAGWLKANGAAVSRTVYAKLFAAIGTRYGAGDGYSTFNLPDLRGEFARFWDDGRGVDAGRALGSFQGDAIRNITGFVSMAGGFFDDAIGAFALNGNTASSSPTQNNGHADDFSFDASRVVPTANENRPRNIALLACIKI